MHPLLHPPPHPSTTLNSVERVQWEAMAGGSRGEAEEEEVVAGGGLKQTPRESGKFAFAHTNKLLSH